MPKATLSLRAGESGYTLIELLVVMAVIALLVAAAPAIVSTARPGAEGRAATYALAEALRGARLDAIMSDAEKIVLLDLDTRTYVASDGATHRLSAGIGWEFQGPYGARKETPVQLSFYPDGSSSGGRIRVFGASRERVIVAHRLTGRISIDE